MIAVVEDEKELCESLKLLLTDKGYEIVTAGSCGEADKYIGNPQIDMFLLDVKLPDGSGFDICRKIRKSSEEVPVIFLTSCDNEEEIVTGLDIGADDYITKPFGMTELIARIRAVLRRYEKTHSVKTYKAGNLYVNPAKHIIEVSGQQITLSYKEYSLLMVLLEAEGNVVERETLLSKVWGEYYTESRTLDVHIRKLRIKLNAAGDVIETVKGIGYKIGGAESE